MKTVTDRQRLLYEYLWVSNKQTEIMKIHDLVKFYKVAYKKIAKTFEY